MKKKPKAERNNPRQVFAYVDEKGFDAETRTLRAVISTKNEDRHGEIVNPRAFEKRIGHYLANPVVLAGHQHKLSDGSVPVIGRVRSLEITDDEVAAVIEFAPADVNPLGPQYERAYELGFMRAFSVGFLPHEIKMEQGQPPEHTDAELIELSCCAVGSNRQALSGEGKSFAQIVEASPSSDPEPGAVMPLAAMYRDEILSDCPMAVRAWVTGGDLDVEKVAQILRDRPALRARLLELTREDPVPSVSIASTDGMTYTVTAKDGLLSVDTELSDDDEDEPVVTLAAETLEALKAAETAIGAHAAAISDAADRLERAVAALLGASEEPPESERTSGPTNLTVEGVLGVLLKNRPKA